VLRENILAYWELLKGVLIVTRVMAFEKFTALFFFFYLLSAVSIALILSIMHWGAGVVFMLFALITFTKTLNNTQFLKRLLIRKGDRIEYADPKEEEGTAMFKKANIILKMRHNEVEKTKLISPELIEGNKHFYLVKAGKDVDVIAYDWIIGLSPEILDIDFAHEDLKTV